MGKYSFFRRGSQAQDLMAAIMRNGIKAAVIGTTIKYMERG
jgi:hypothetical protein